MAPQVTRRIGAIFRKDMHNLPEIFPKETVFSKTLLSEVDFKCKGNDVVDVRLGYRLEGLDRRKSTR
jgi:hypothetical protein